MRNPRKSKKLVQGLLPLRVVVLRIGHRIPRDSRITTHVCLTARALGADGVYISDVSDRELIETVNRVSKRFGGIFHVEAGGSWRSTLTEWKRSGGRVVHLTAYGLPLPKIIRGIRRSRRDILVVVGAEKVPGALYGLADWNVAVTNQPISEVSALGIFLDWFFNHKRLEVSFPRAEIKIVPSASGKRVVTN
jgi:tRNA (cytidine56-2'-O)-methyltransferase